jgi:hypothetical protein
VSFHGGLTNLTYPEVDITPYVLVLYVVDALLLPSSSDTCCNALLVFVYRSGGADDAHGNQTELEAGLNTAKAEWEITRYSFVRHGFTSWTSDAYSPTADYRSWQSMLTVMAELMPLSTSVVTNVTKTDAPAMVPALMPTMANVSLPAPVSTTSTTNGTTIMPAAAPMGDAPVVGSSPVVSPTKAPSPPKATNDPSSAGVILASARLSLMLSLILLLAPSFAGW